MQHAGQWAYSHNCKKLMVVTTEANTAANNLYTSLEFQLVNKYHYRIPKAYMTENDLTTSLNLQPVSPLPDATKKYFDVCQEKLGLIPNVLKAHSFNIDKLNAFTGLYNELMLADSNLSKLEREMIAVVVSSINRCFYCLTAHGAAVRELSGDQYLVKNW